MVPYIVRRTLLSVFTLFTISYLSFVIIELPEGDFVDFYARFVEQTTGRSVSFDEMEDMRESFGLNRPQIVQYWDWVSGVVTGDFGYAYLFGDLRTPIRMLIAERLPTTIFLTGFTIVFIFVLSIPVGIYSAVRQHSVGDYTVTLLGFTGLAVPDFLLGLVLMYLFLAYFNQSVGGLFSGEYQSAPWSVGKVLDLMQHMIIPAIVLGTAGLASGIRTMRNNLLDELYKPYVVAARAKGLANWKVIVKYPVRVAINPLVSGLGGTLPALVGGSVIVSIVLSLPTLGPLLLFAIRGQNNQLAGTIVLFLGALTVVGVLISDLLLVLVDPRIKLTGSAR